MFRLPSLEKLVELRDDMQGWDPIFSLLPVPYYGEESARRVAAMYVCEIFEYKLEAVMDPKKVYLSNLLGRRFLAYVGTAVILSAMW